MRAPLLDLLTACVLLAHTVLGCSWHQHGAAATCNHSHAPQAQSGPACEGHSHSADEVTEQFTIAACEDQHDSHLECVYRVDDVAHFPVIFSAWPVCECDSFSSISDLSWTGLPNAGGNAPPLQMCAGDARALLQLWLI